MFKSIVELELPLPLASAVPGVGPLPAHGSGLAVFSRAWRPPTIELCALRARLPPLLHLVPHHVHDRDLGLERGRDAASLCLCGCAGGGEALVPRGEAVEAGFRAAEAERVDLERVVGVRALCAGRGGEGPLGEGRGGDRRRGRAAEGYVGIGAWGSYLFAVVGVAAVGEEVEFVVAHCDLICLLERTEEKKRKRWEESRGRGYRGVDSLWTDCRLRVLCSISSVGCMYYRM